MRWSNKEEYEITFTEKEIDDMLASVPCYGFITNKKRKVELKIDYLKDQAIKADLLQKQVNFLTKFSKNSLKKRQEKLNKSLANKFKQEKEEKELQTINILIRDEDDE